MGNQFCIDIKCCPRRGESHTVSLRPLTRQTRWTHWAMCPTANEPLMVEETVRMDYAQTSASIIVGDASALPTLWLQADA